MHFLSNFRRQLAYADISWQLTLMGVMVGIFASTAILLFRLTVESLQLLFLQIPDDFSGLDALERLQLPFAGALLLFIIARRSNPIHHRMGIPYVLHRLRKFYGYIPLGNTINQFFTATAALTFGFSVGREGPSVHLGAGSASLLTQKLGLPDNSRRTLVACGIAAGIAASFNTPLAALVFVLEVVLQRYRIYQFLPIMLSSLIGAAMSQLAFGDIHPYADISIPSLGIHDLLPLSLPLVTLGLAVGLMAVLFNRSLLLLLKRTSGMKYSLRLALAAVILGLVGWQIPQAMGTEDGAVSLALSDHPSLMLLLVVLIGKLITTISALGLGVPGGVIGVLFGIGSLLGSLIIWSLAPFYPILADYAAMAALIAMVAMMAASLNAPLAALVAMLELSQNAAIIFPCLLVVLPAILLSHQVFRLKSLFYSQLDLQRLPYKNSPVLHTLQETGVMALARQKFINLDEQQSWQEQLSSLPMIITNTPTVKPPYHEQGEPVFQMPSSQLGYRGAAATLITVPGLPEHSTLAEAYECLSPRRRGYVVLYNPKSRQPVGLIGWHSLQKQLHKEQL